MPALQWLSDLSQSMIGTLSNSTMSASPLAASAGGPPKVASSNEQLPWEELLDRNLDDSTGQAEYDRGREKLVRSEQDTAWDASARRSASEREIAADRIMRGIRENDRVNHYGNLPTEAVPGPETRDMGGKFLVNLDRIESSRLFQILKKMPKGANLHLHFNAALNPELFVSRARGMPTMFVRSTRPLLQDEDYDNAEIVFSVLPADTTTADIFSSEYNPEFKAPGSQPWMHWTAFCTVYEEKKKGNAEEFVLQKMVLSEDEVYDKTQTVNGIWAKFNQATRCFKGLFNYESAYRWYIGALLESFIQDKIMYTELRPMLLDKSIPTDDGLRKLNHADQMRIILEEVQNKMQHCQKRSFPFGVKIIYCAPRSIPKPIMQRELKDCIRLKLEFGDLICGFDLVGAEDRPNSINYYRSELLAFQKTCKQLNLDIPFMFHAGESLLDTGGSSDPAQSNLFDAVMLDSKRIGHGIAVLNHIELTRIFRERKIAIEVCPISNEILHLCSNAKEHSIPQLLAQGIPCTIASDNPSIFRYARLDSIPKYVADVSQCSSSLSHDFYQVLVGDITMSLHGLRQIVEWSIDYSCLTLEQKKEAREILKEDWEAFCNWVVDTFETKAES